MAPLLVFPDPPAALLAQTLDLAGLRWKAVANASVATQQEPAEGWSGALICYEGTVEDVTEKFEAERNLRIALRQAEIANKMKAAFLAAMSHELKTPLNAVLGFSEIIRDEMLGPAGVPAYVDYAADIHRSGRATNPYTWLSG